MGLRFFDREHYLSFESIGEGSMLDHIPAHVYTIAILPEKPPRLIKDRKNFSIAERKYGRHNRYVSLVTGEYDPTNGPLGVLAVGLKGSGKSLLCEEICNWALRRDMPVIIIDKAYTADFLRAMVRVIGPCVLYFDEFGKIYRPNEESGDDAREAMLSFFSDSEMKGVINLVTANEKEELSEYMINRPGRFKYRFRFDCIKCIEAMELIREYNLNKELTDAVLRIVYFNYVSWDMLRAIVQIARECVDVEDFADKTSYLNVPPAVWPAMDIKAAYYEGRRLFGEEFSISYRYPMLMVKIHTDDGDPIDKFQFNIEDETIMGELECSHEAISFATAAASTEAEKNYRVSETLDMPEKAASDEECALARVGMYRHIRPDPKLRLIAHRSCSTTRTVANVSTMTRVWEELRAKEMQLATEKPVSGTGHGTVTRNATALEPADGGDIVQFQPSSHAGQRNIDVAREIAGRQVSANAGEK